MRLDISKQRRACHFNGFRMFVVLDLKLHDLGIVSDKQKTSLQLLDKQILDKQILKYAKHPARPVLPQAPLMNPLCCSTWLSRRPIDFQTGTTPFSHFETIYILNQKNNFSSKQKNTGVV